MRSLNTDKTLTKVEVKPAGRSVDLAEWQEADRACWPKAAW